MCPQDLGRRILLEVPVDSVGVGMRMQEQSVLLRQLDHLAHVGQVGIGTVDMELADRHEEVFAVVGWHPNAARSFALTDLDRLRDWYAHPKVVGIGEIGLDYFRDHATPIEQREATIAQLRLASALDSPVVVHCRDAYDDLLDLFEHEKPRLWVLHCFAGTTAHAERALGLGAYFGVDGPITYKSANALRETIALLPRDRVVVETDAPFLPPEPHRGRENQPAYSALVNLNLAQLWGVSPEEAAAITTQNAEALFPKLR